MADIAQRPASVGHQQARALVKILGQFADRFHRQIKLPTLLAAGQRIEAEHEVIGFRHHAVDLAHEVVELVGIACQRVGEGFEIMQRVLHRLLIVGDHPIDVLQRAADRLGDVLQRIWVGGQHGHTVFIPRHRRSGIVTAGQRNRSNSGQALEFQPDLGVLADRGVVLDHRQCDDTSRIVELYRDDLAHPDTVEIDAAAVAQAGCRPLEDDAQWRARLGGVQALKPEHEAERRGDHCQRERSDQDVIRPRFHLSQLRC